MASRRGRRAAKEQTKMSVSALFLLLVFLGPAAGFVLRLPSRAAGPSTRMQALRPFDPTIPHAVEVLDSLNDDDGDLPPLFDHDYDDRRVAIRAHGRHVCLDYTGFRVEAVQGAEATLAAIRAAVSESGVREVHSRVVVLGEDGLSPPGFTGVCLVDESHVTAHCYSDRGWLAIDVFTCGAHPPEDIARGVHARLLAAVPELHLVRGVTLDRFLHHDLEDGRVGGGESGAGAAAAAGAAEAAAGREVKAIAAVAA